MTRPSQILAHSPDAESLCETTRVLHFHIEHTEESGTVNKMGYRDEGERTRGGNGRVGKLQFAGGWDEGIP